ncbi:hypothetical protein ASG76_00890 [Nocardioides sp. Soil774]|nr:hypothetical protein ASG76_00890 [Nocardioides sp. Soil774]
MSADEICIVSGGDEVRYRSYVNHRIYAAEAGCDFRLEIGLGRPASTPYHYKFNLIDHVLPRYRWIVYVDDDVYFTDWRADRLVDLVNESERRGLWGVIAEGPTEPSGVWSAINTGVMVLRNDERTRTVLDTARSADIDDLRSAWDSTADGLFTSGDQDAIWATVKGQPSIREHLEVVSHERLNSRPHLYDGGLDSALAVHFCGPGDKRANVARFAERFGLGHELVPTALLDKYDVRRRERVSAVELQRRAVAERSHALARRIGRKMRWIRENRSWS